MNRHRKNGEIVTWSSILRPNLLLGSRSTTLRKGSRSWPFHFFPCDLFSWGNLATSCGNLASLAFFAFGSDFTVGLLLVASSSTFSILSIFKFSPGNPASSFSLGRLLAFTPITFCWGFPVKIASSRGQTSLISTACSPIRFFASVATVECNLGISTSGCCWSFPVLSLRCAFATIGLLVCPELTWNKSIKTLELKVTEPQS